MGKTIYDIAKAAGVSIATVSRVFNNFENVTEKTREKVLKVASEMDYHPQAFAQGLASKKKNMIMVVVPVISNYFFMEVLAGIQDKLSDFDFELNIVNIKPDEDTLTQIENQLKRQWAEGYIFISIHLSSEQWESIRRYETPIVIIDDYFNGFDSVSVDNVKGMHRATRHFIDQELTRIAMISASATSKPIIDRLKGYKLALDESGITYDENLVVSGDTLYRDGFTERGGYEAMRKILKMDTLPEACVCASDVKAIGALKAMRDSGIEIPIISYDNLAIAEFMGLTTVRQPMYDMGFLATQNLLDRFAKPDKPSSHTIYSPELVVRSSSIIQSKIHS